VSAVECYGTNSVGLGLVISSTNAASQLYFTSILQKKKKPLGSHYRASLHSLISSFSFFFQFDLPIFFNGFN
jgi:hypothetical protein